VIVVLKEGERAMTTKAMRPKQGLQKPWNQVQVRSEFRGVRPEIRYQWVEWQAYQYWLARGCSHGGDKEDWEKAELEVDRCLEAARDHYLESGRGEEWLTVTRYSSAAEAVRFLKGLIAPQSLRLVRPDEEEQDATSNNQSMEEVGMSIGYGKIIGVTRDQPATEEDRRLAEMNRDPSEFLSPEDRAKYAGQWVAIMRVGTERGSIAGHGSTGQEAGKYARSKKLRSGDYVLHFLSPAAELGSSDIATVSPAK
jgi:hypothetical protein